MIGEQWKAEIIEEKRSSTPALFRQRRHSAANALLAMRPSTIAPTANKTNTCAIAINP
jgi:hypothetical protein